MTKQQLLMYAKFFSAKQDFTLFEEARFAQALGEHDPELGRLMSERVKVEERVRDYCLARLEKRR